MNIRKYILLVIAIVLFVGCNSDKDEGGKRNDKVKVYITASHDLATRSSFEDEVIVVDTEPAQSTNTRTELGPVENETTLGDEQKIYWSEDDSFVMWAAPTGTTTYNLGFNAKVFERDTYNYDFNTADFVTELGRVMDASPKYDYYAAYPVPNDPNFGAYGTSVTYNLKTTQSGDYDPAMDVMYATVTNANALVPRDPKQTATNDRVWDEPELHFSHMLHTLRIWVPAGKNLMDKPIKRLDIVFPGDVVGGTLSFSAANPTQPTWKGQSDRVTIEFADGDLLNAEGRYVWVYIKPENLSGQMTFRAYDQNGVPSKAITTTLSNHNFQAQHITPIKLTIPEMIDPITIKFSCPDEGNYLNFLGESATEMNIQTWPAGIASASGATTITSDNGVFTADFYYFNEDGGQYNANLSEAEMTVYFKSAHANINTLCTIKMPNLTESTDAFYSLPYLFYEDFNSAESKDVPGVSTATSQRPAEELSGLQGWYGAICGLTKGKSATIASYIGSTFVGTRTNYHTGRIDSPAMAITANTNISVKYDIDGETIATAADNYCYFGLTYRIGGIPAGIKGNNTYPDVQVDNYEINNDSSSGTNITSSKTHQNIENCGVGARLSWCNNPTNVKDGLIDYVTGKYFYFYLDNVKVSIGGTTKHTDIDKDYRSFFPNHVN